MSMPPSPSPQRGAVLAMLATIVLWAYSWIVMKQVLAWAGPFDFAALRYLLGALVLLAALALAIVAALLLWARRGGWVQAVGVGGIVGGALGGFAYRVLMAEAPVEGGATRRATAS